MKKVLLLFALIACVNVNAQDIELTETGAYEKKVVVVVDSAKAIVLFERAMIALSDWTGPDGKAKAGIDYQEKETGTVIYKGMFSLGFKNVFLGDGWNRYADFVLKVRCKDGKAQVTITVPQITAVYNRNGMKSSASTAQCVQAVKDAKGKKHKRGVALLNDLTSTVDGLASAMVERLKKGNDDDDF